MEYWEFINITKNRVCLISEINELDEHIQWTLRVECPDKVIYMGMDFQNVEIVFKEVND